MENIIETTDDYKFWYDLNNSAVNWRNSGGFCPELKKDIVVTTDDYEFIDDYEHSFLLKAPFDFGVGFSELEDGSLEEVDDIGRDTDELIDELFSPDSDEDKLFVPDVKSATSDRFTKVRHMAL